MTSDGTHYERVLRERLDGHEADAASIADSMNQLRAARADGTADDEHDPEGSTLTSDWSRIAGLAVEAEARRREILAALDRLADGSFGRCTSCGGAIAEGRLDARPWASQCIGCASR